MEASPTSPKLRYLPALWHIAGLAVLKVLIWDSWVFPKIITFDSGISKLSSAFIFRFDYEDQIRGYCSCMIHPKLSKGNNLAIYYWHLLTLGPLFTRVKTKILPPQWCKLQDLNESAVNLDPKISNCGEKPTHRSLLSNQLKSQMDSTWLNHSDVGAIPFGE